MSINDTVFNVRHTENTDIAICNTVPKVHFFMQHRNAFEVAMEGRGIDMLLFLLPVTMIIMILVLVSLFWTAEIY